MSREARRTVKYKVDVDMCMLVSGVGEEKQNIFHFLRNAQSTSLGRINTLILRIIGLLGALVASFETRSSLFYCSHRCGTRA